MGQRDMINKKNEYYLELFEHVLQISVVKQSKWAKQQNSQERQEMQKNRDKMRQQEFGRK